MKTTRFKAVLYGGLLASNAAVFGGSWPQYRGPAGDGESSETVHLPLPPGGPKRLWRVETPGGFSSFAVDNGKVFTLFTRNIEGAPRVVCAAFDAGSGKELWAVPTGVAMFQHGGDSGAPGNEGGDGARSTPTVNGNRVYVYSAEMVLYCLDAATGKSLWQKDVIKEFNGRNIGWKSAMSPVVAGGVVYIAGGGPGEAMLAFDAGTGAVRWKSGDERFTHATPVPATLGGVRQVIYLMQSGLVGVDAGTGKQLWKFPFPYQTATGCSPVVAGNDVFCTAGYGVGGAACEVSNAGGTFSARELWRNRGNNVAASLWSTPVARDGFLYGMISYKQFANGPLKCIDFKSGELKWQQPGFGAGNVLLAGDCLIALTDDGHVVIVQANPNGYHELARFKAINGKCWSTPALSNGRLYVRSTKEGACFELNSAAGS